MTSMIVWSQDVHGIISMSQRRKKTVCRSKSARRVRTKTLFQHFSSLQAHPNAKSYDSMECTSIDSSTSYGSTFDCDTIYEPWQRETNLY